MNQKTYTYSAPVAPWLTPLLFISGMVLCILKGAGHLHWDWWVVLIPLYPFILAILIPLVVYTIAFFVIIPLLILTIPLLILVEMFHQMWDRWKR